jgi:hypothetical protein
MSDCAPITIDAWRGKATSTANALHRTVYANVSAVYVVPNASTRLKLEPRACVKPARASPGRIVVNINDLRYARVLSRYKPNAIETTDPKITDAPPRVEEFATDIP